MGLLDRFTGMTPEENEGLLGMAAQMLAAGGPSRQPTSFGQGLGAGLQGFSQAKSEAERRRLEREQAALQAKLMGFKVKDAESDLQNQELARQRAAGLQQFYKDYAGRQGGAEGQGGAAPMLPLSSLPQQSKPGLQQPAGGVGGQKSSIFDERLAMAQALRAQGYAAEADAQEAQALKFQPKVKDWKQVKVNGQVLYAPLFEDGSPGQPMPYEAAVELDRANTGGSTELYNPITGNTVRSMKNTADPNAILSAQTAIRGQNMVDARAREANQTSKAPPGYRFMPDGSLQAIRGGPADLKASKEGVQRTQDANDVLSILNEAEPLLKTSTSSYIGAGADQVMRAFGSSTTGGEAAAQLKVLQGQLVAKMPKMSGPQSDKDVQLYREMAGQIGDPTLPESTRQAAANTIRSLNEKYLGLKPGSSRPAKPEGPASPRAPMKGQVVEGFKFKGGDPADRNNWERQ